MIPLLSLAQAEKGGRFSGRAGKILGSISLPHYVTPVSPRRGGYLPSPVVFSLVVNDEIRTRYAHNLKACLSFPGQSVPLRRKRQIVIWIQLNVSHNISVLRSPLQLSSVQNNSSIFFLQTLLHLLVSLFPTLLLTPVLFWPLRHETMGNLAVPNAKSRNGCASSLSRHKRLVHIFFTQCTTHKKGKVSPQARREESQARKNVFSRTNDINYRMRVQASVYPGDCTTAINLFSRFYWAWNP